MSEGRLVDIGDTRLWVVERGNPGGLPLIALHGGPGLDHHAFGNGLDPLGDLCRIVLVDERAEGRSDRDAPLETWTLEQKARDVSALARVLGYEERYAVLGHSYGAFIALQHAVDSSGDAAATIIYAGIPDMRFLAHVEQELATFEPEDLRAQVAASWEAEAHAQTEDDVRALVNDQLPFHFADPRDPRIEDVKAALADARFNPAVGRAAATDDYGGIALEDRLRTVTQPVLVIAGRHDRTCSLEANEAIANGIPGAELVVLEHSAHFGLLEEPERFLDAVRTFLSAC